MLELTEHGEIGDMRPDGLRVTLKGEGDPDVMLYWSSSDMAGS